MAEIRTTGLSQKTVDRWQKVSDLLGTTTHASTMAAVTNLVYLLYCSSRWEDVQRKAATLITAQWAARNKEVVPMHPTEVKRVSMDGGGVLVFTRSQGEPYRITSEVWERG